MPAPAPLDDGLTRGVPALLDHAPAGFLSVSTQGPIALVNATLASLLEYQPAELVGQHVRTIFTPSTRIFYQTHFFPMLRMQQRAEEIYLTLKSKSGEQVPVLANAAVREQDGAEFIDCIFLRIQERQKYEEQLLLARRAADEANRAKVEFLSMMSHDLRTPLNAVNGYADLLLMGVRGALNAEQTKDLERIKGAGAFLLGLINDILSFARLELGRADLQIKPVKLAPLMDQTDELLGGRMRESGVGVLRAPIPDELIVSADPDRVQQILLNLLSNASKFTPSGGRVTVTAARDGDQVKIRVADTGRGIPADRLEEIFRPFSQVDPQEDKKKGGVGLGLAIGRELARSMGGDLTVTSEVGRGSEFTVSLPAG